MKFKKWLEEFSAIPFPVLPIEKRPKSWLGGFYNITSKTKREKSKREKDKEDRDEDGYYL